MRSRRPPSAERPRFTADPDGRCDRMYKSVCVSSDGASAQHTGEPRVHSRDHVRVFQRPGSLHRRSGAFSRRYDSFTSTPFLFVTCSSRPASGRPGAGRVLDVQTGGRADPDGDRDRQRRRGHARHPRGKHHFSVRPPFSASSPSNVKF